MITTAIAVVARLTSTRLNNKCLLDVAGKSLFERLINNCSLSLLSNQIVLCTSREVVDDPLVTVAERLGIDVVRGDPLDVMSRFLILIDRYSPEYVVRVTGDNPLTDPRMIDEMVKAHTSAKADYSYTEDIPVGTRPEVISADFLKSLYPNLVDPTASEYMTWMLRRADLFNTLQYKRPTGTIAPGLRLTVDYPEDLVRIEEIYKNFPEGYIELKEVERFLINRGLAIYEKIEDSQDCREHRFDVLNGFTTKRS